ncbi:MAG: hypothetical protein WCV85_05530 [Patescibacteria group bacterium]|jgi:orotate phosphoribosyltransferase
MRKYTDDEMIARLERVGVIVHNTHVKLSNGCCTRTYANFVPGLVPREERSVLVSEAAALVQHSHSSAPVIVGAGCGSYYALQVADLLGLSFAYAERAEGGVFRFKREQTKLIANRNIVLFDDVLTTSTTLTKLGKLVKACGGMPTQGIVLLNRSQDSHVVPELDAEVPIHQLMERYYEMWPSEALCPECAKGNRPSPNIEGGERVFRQHGYRAQS